MVTHFLGSHYLLFLNLFTFIVVIEPYSPEKYQEYLNKYTKTISIGAETWPVIFGDPCREFSVRPPKSQVFDSKFKLRMI